MPVLYFKSGTPPTEVVESIRSLAFDPDCFGSTDNYIDRMIDNLACFHEKHVTVTGNTTEERAASLVSELRRCGLIEFE
jgi:hypothetical protein